MTALDASVRRRLRAHLVNLYGDAADDCLNRIAALVQRFESPLRSSPKELWNERDIVLITYGDQVQNRDVPSLRVLNDFLIGHGLNRLINTVHILPFFPYSSDDGFSVIDYRRVDPPLGDWDDVARLGQSFDLMFDLVLNHCSSQNEWFRKVLAGEKPYSDYFIEPEPDADLSNVTRPRSSPLLTEYETADGPRNVWTTFSADQVDLNFAQPDVLLEMLDVLLFYVQQGARIIRLDAIAYLWKTPGTTCIHLPQAHEVVKLMRTLLEAVAPGTILLTETNVPHRENVSYFGDGDEAQMVYQFSLAPLLLDAFLTGDAGPFVNWLSNLELPGRGMTFMIFTASHDGVGVRPLEGLVDSERIERLAENVRRRGGLVSTRRRPDGTDSPYELNVSYFSALGESNEEGDERQVQRFLSSQAVMLALAGIPAVYFHSLVGTPNDQAGVQRTGQPRSINRRKYGRRELEAALQSEDSAQRRVYEGYRRLLAARIGQPAFHPHSPQQVVDLQSPSVTGFVRGDDSGGQRILVAVNVGNSDAMLDLQQCGIAGVTRDLITGTVVADSTNPVLPAHDAAWWELRS